MVRRLTPALAAASSICTKVSLTRRQGSTGLPRCASLCYRHNVAQTGTTPNRSAFANPRLRDALADGRQCLTRRRVDSDNTRLAYRRHLVIALTHLGVQTVAQAYGAQLAGYRAPVTTSSLAPASQAQILTAVRSFLG